MPDETYESPLFGEEGLRCLATALKISGDGIERIEIEFDTFQLFGAIHVRRSGKWEIYTCDEVGIRELRQALELPYSAQKLTIRIGLDGYMSAEYRMVAGDQFAARLEAFSVRTNSLTEGIR